jgi:hypothetical protein
MLTRLSAISDWLEEAAGLRVGWVLLSLLALSACGAVLGFAFPKYEASALLQTPTNTIDLPAFRRAMAGHASRRHLQAYVESRGFKPSTAVARLVWMSEKPAFWDQAIRPMLPFSRRDQREFGEFKDVSSATLLGVVLTLDAGSETVVTEMLGLLSEFVANVLFRERIQGWAQAGLAEAMGREKRLQAEVIRAELDIQQLETRVDEMKAVLAKYPDAARMDSRQVVNVNPDQGGERFLPPLAQLVSFESAVSQRRESVRRLVRDIKQSTLSAPYFADAVARAQGEVQAAVMLPALRDMAKQHFSGPQANEEWAEEVALRVNGALDSFEVGFRQLGVRDGVRVTKVALRSPLFMALLFAGLGAGAFAGWILVRLSVQSARTESAS